MTELGQMPGDARKRITDSPPPTREPIRLTAEAEAAWLKWVYENADLFNTDRLSFVAGFRAARLAGGPTLADARMVQVPAQKVTALMEVLDRYSTRRRDIQALRDAAWDVIYSRRAIPPTVAALRTPESETTDGD